MNMNNLHSYQQRPSRLCAVCGSYDRELLLQQNFSLITNGGSLLSGYDVVACSECGFCFADHIPEQTVFDTYYREMSKYEYQDNLGQVSKYGLAKFKLIVNTLKIFLQNPTDRILEIGCSTGALLSILKGYGYADLTGVDPSPKCAEIARNLYGIKVITSTLSEIVEECNLYDVLILVGVIEHIRNLKSALEKCWNLLSNNGFIYLEVPDASHYDEGEDAPFQEFSVEHINFFGSDSLNNLMIANGFKKVFTEQDMVEANYRTTTPIIQSIYKKSDNKSAPSFLADIKTKQGIQRYINQCIQVDNQIQSSISRIAADRQPIIVWGTGAHTLRLLATSKLREANIQAFIDSNTRYQGKQLNGVPIVSPHEIINMPHPILISSRVYQEEISNQILTDLHLVNKIIKLY